MTRAAIRRRLQELRERLSPPQPVVIGATLDVRSGKLRNILTDDGAGRPAPPDLTVEDLPRGCSVFRYNPSRECVSLFRSTADGRCHAQIVAGVDEDVVLGRAPAWDAPLDQWPAIFAGQQVRDEPEQEANAR
jgi:hypothetical protein